VRVAVVCPYDLSAPGGVQDQVVSIVEWLREEGQDAWAVAPGEAGPTETHHVGGIVRVPANRSRAPIALDPRVVRRVRSAIRGADVVHIHEPLMPMVSLAALLAGDQPKVATFHADPAAVVRNVYRGAAGVLRRLLRRASVVTAVSETAAAAAARFVTAEIVPNGVDVGSYRAAETERDPATVLFLGRDEPRKGLDVLLQAWPLIRARVPAARAFVVGAERSRGPDGVAYLGRVSDDQKRAELAGAAVLCAPNLGGESFGIVLIEAMAAGCAVVASDLPSFRSVGGDAVVFVEPGDPTALADRVSRLLEDDTARHERVRLGTERVARFDRGRVLDAYLDAYRRACNRGAGSG
jgi:phosphatidylinositol alpha-mannosyltransferase